MLTPLEKKVLVKCETLTVEVVEKMLELPRSEWDAFWRKLAPENKEAMSLFFYQKVLRTGKL